MKKIKKILSNKYFIFIVAFLIMFLYLLPINNLINGSLDASETIKVIKTFFSSNKHISYVMYKGIFAFLPGVFCYNLGNLLNISWILLMKIFHSLGFAYITVVGFPYLIKFLFKKEPKTYQKYLMIILFVILEADVFFYISIDFMSLSLLILCINSLIKIINKKDINKFQYLYSGLLLGTCTCLSGQFLPSAVILIIYAIYLIVSKNKKQKVWIILIALLIFISGIILPKTVDKIYFNKVVNPARESGEWLPTGKEWLLTGFTLNMQTINYPAALPDNLGKTIIISEKLNKDTISAGGALYSDIKSIIKVVLRYPVLFCIRWTERLFLGILNDPNNYLFLLPLLSPLLSIILMGSLIYVSLLALKNGIKKFKNLFNYQSLIVISFILSSLVPSIGHVENRYYLSIRALIMSVFCLSPFIPKVIDSIILFFDKYNLKNIKEYKINYNIITYFIFIIIIILLYAAIYQSGGANTDITYEFFK